MLNRVPQTILLNLKSNLSIKDIDLFIFHQASKLLIDNLSKKLNIPSDKMCKNNNKIGNTVYFPIAKEAKIKNYSKAMILF